MKKIVFVLACVVLAVFCQARIITVDDDGPADFNNIQAAIIDANDGDRIIVNKGIYIENIKFKGKNIILTSTDPNDPAIVETTVIDGNQNGSVIRFSGNEAPKCVLTGFTITGGNPLLYPDDLGGGIYGNRTLATISKCIIRNNSGRLGGGLYRCDGLISNCIVNQNMGQGGGGGFGYCKATIINCIIRNNTGIAGGMFECPSHIKNCIISGNYGDVFRIAGGFSHITNCTISNTGGAAVASYNMGYVYVANSILWANGADFDTACGSKSTGFVITDYSILQSNWQGSKCVTVNNCIVADPCFADVNNSDYHVKSQAGRWDPNTGSWAKDDVTSIAIDAGDPASPIGFEPFPNGGIINIGAYGGTAEASKSYFGQPLCETIVAGDVNGDCKVNFEDFRLMALHWVWED